MNETEQGIDVEAPAEAGEHEMNRERQQAREQAYQDVSVRAVELLAKAQRAADEAVAQAQAYARDLEETAREQYRSILQRAQDSAREAATGISESGDEGGGQGAAAAATVAGVAGAESHLEARQLEYVRTYARVAHTQLKAVLGALTDELDRLGDLAEHGTTSGGSGAPARSRAEEVSADEVSADAAQADGSDSESGDSSSSDE